jgi:hypothetical protein
MGGTAGGNARFDLAVQSNMQLLWTACFWNFSFNIFGLQLTTGTWNTESKITGAVGGRECLSMKFIDTGFSPFTLSRTSNSLLAGGPETNSGYYSVAWQSSPPSCLLPHCQGHIQVSSCNIQSSFHYLLLITFMGCTSAWWKLPGSLQYHPVILAGIVSPAQLLSTSSCAFMEGSLGQVCLPQVTASTIPVLQILLTPERLFFVIASVSISNLHFPKREERKRKEVNRFEGSTLWHTCIGTPGWWEGRRPAEQNDMYPGR